MKTIKNGAELKQAIADLEQRKDAQQLVIKEQVQLSKRALSPVNIVKNTFSRIAEIPEVRKTMINTIIGFGLGFISKKTAKLLSEDSLNHMVSNLLDYTADHVIQKDPDSLLSKGVHFARLAVKEKVLTA